MVSAPNHRLALARKTGSYEQNLGILEFRKAVSWPSLISRSGVIAGLYPMAACDLRKRTLETVNLGEIDRFCRQTRQDGALVTPIVGGYSALRLTSGWVKAETRKVLSD